MSCIVWIIFAVISFFLVFGVTLLSILSIGFLWTHLSGELEISDLILKNIFWIFTFMFLVVGLIYNAIFKRMLKKYPKLYRIYKSLIPTKKQ